MSEFYDKISTTKITEWVFFCPEHLSRLKIEIMSFLIWKMNWFYLTICHHRLTPVLIITFFYSKIRLS